MGAMGANAGRAIAATAAIIGRCNVRNRMAGANSRRGQIVDRGLLYGLRTGKLDVPGE